jgi:hypothetical protein
MGIFKNFRRILTSVFVSFATLARVAKLTNYFQIKLLWQQA